MADEKELVPSDKAVKGEKVPSPEPVAKEQEPMQSVFNPSSVKVTLYFDRKNVIFPPRTWTDVPARYKIPRVSGLTIRKK